MRYLWTVLGVISTALGIIGIVLPIMPGTVFLIFAGFCFAKGSPRLHKWLLENKWFGEYARDWEKNKSIPLKAKILAPIMIGISIGISVLFFIANLVGQIVLIIFGISTIYYILTRPTST